MINSLYHAEIGGGYTKRRKIIINAADLRQLGGEIEVAALDDTGNALNSATVTTEADALRMFKAMVQQYAGPLQKAVAAAGLIPGHCYTLFYLSDFGFPVVEKIVFRGFTFTTYAQHADAVRLEYAIYPKRSTRCRLFYDSSLLIFDGWQNVPESATVDTLREGSGVKITRSKYESFSPSYIEDAAAMLKNPVMIFKNYRRGVSGKLYA